MRKRSSIRYAACVEMPARPVSQFTADTLALIDRNPVETVCLAAA